MLAVTKAGATSGDLARAAIAANGGRKPWLPHFYLGHGIGTYPAEAPMIGTDLGEEFDDNFVFPPGNGPGARTGGVGGRNRWLSQ